MTPSNLFLENHEISPLRLKTNQAYSALNSLNLDAKDAREKRKLQLSEPEELRLETYENSKLYNE